MKPFILLLLLISLSTMAQDLTPDFHRFYGETFSEEELATLKQKKVILIPGIMSETFVWGDLRGPIDFSVITKDYFGTQLSFLREAGIPVKRLLASSRDVSETLTEIDALFSEDSSSFIFISHSLGGMALLDYLLLHPEKRNRVAGVIFLQSPFSGAPMATVIRQYPFLERFFPLAYTSRAVVKYLSVEERKDFILNHEEGISDLVADVPVITAAGVVNDYKSLFSASASIIRTGCLETVRGRCIGKRFYRGPYDDSDGMVPFESSKLPGAAFVRLPGVDHGEKVVNIPFQNFTKTKSTTALLKILLGRQNF